jgi:hypothetical protein
MYTYMSSLFVGGRVYSSRGIQISSSRPISRPAGALNGGPWNIISQTTQKQPVSSNVAMFEGGGPLNQMQANETS